MLTSDSCGVKTPSKFLLGRPWLDARPCLLSSISVFFQGTPRARQRQEKTRTETSAGTRRIIGGAGGSVKRGCANVAGYEPLVREACCSSWPVLAGAVNEVPDSMHSLEGATHHAVLPLR